MNLPDFVIIGAMKTATTSLHYYLNLHRRSRCRRSIKKISAGSRIIYVLGAPLIPFVRLWYTFGNASQPGRPNGQFIKVLPVIILGLLMDGLGEFAGYVFGEGDTAKAFYASNFIVISIW